MPLTENANYCANCGAKVEPFVEVEEDGAEEADVCECAPTEEAPAEETSVEEAAAEDAGCCCGEGLRHAAVWCFLRRCMKSTGNGWIL